jgi:Outer membrane protein beta-barrel domain
MNSDSPEPLQLRPSFFKDRVTLAMAAAAFRLDLANLFGGSIRDDGFTESQGMSQRYVPVSETMPGGKVKLWNIIVLALAVGLVQLLQAQDCGDECKINSNLAMVVNVPVNKAAQVAGTGFGAVAGTGYNFNQRNAVIGEFMWNRVNPSDGALQPLQKVLQSANLSGETDLYAVTGNYRFEVRGRLLGAYLIGGSGWYLRHTALSREITSGAYTVCTPAWQWWGFTCVAGTVTANQTLATSNSNTWGANAGAGFTVRVSEAPYRLYAEARYHYAPTKNISTEFLAVTFGIRY